MTVEEHQLLIVMFSRQAMLIKTLADIVQSHGLLSSDDLKPFNDFVMHSEMENPQIMHTTANLYLEVAKKLGMDVPTKPRQM
jgi:hypothetical protein